MSFVAKKSLGQNFLQDDEVCRWIANQVSPDRAPFVVEIGPGQGALTEHLIARPQQLVLVEKDDRLVPELQERYGEEDNLTILHQDACLLDTRDWYRLGDVRVIGNLPYSVASVIMKALLHPPTPVKCAVFMFQKEVAQRICATHADDRYGAMSLMLQQDWNTEYLRTLGPELFRPRPKIDSAVVRFTPRDPSTLPVYDRGVYRRVVKLGFSQRRKQLKNLLGDVPNGGWAAMAESLGARFDARAEQLDMMQWIAVARWFEGRKDQDRGQRATEMFDVVDEHNAVIGQEQRSVVHAKGLRHRAVHVFIFDRKGNLYLQKRSHLKDVHPRAWDSSASGHLDVGESYADAALRELREELGIEVETAKKVAEIAACEATGMEFVEVHAARYDGPIKFAPDEIEIGHWFKPETINEWIAARPQDFASGFIACWQQFQSA
jgi:16S rRNA (adenine1518-N6/adenine1519-N6)-dimethyltransferase